MEQVRLLLAIGLSFIVLFVWSVFFVDKQPVTPNEAEKVTNSEPIKQEAKNESQLPAASEPVKSKIKKQEIFDEKTISIDTPNYIVKISNKGATFTSFVLKKYKETAEPGSPNKELIPEELSDGIFHASVSNHSMLNMANGIFSVNTEKDKITINNGIQSLNYRWVSDNGIIVNKTYRFDPKSYLIGLEITIENQSTNLFNDELVLSMRKAEEEAKGYGFTGPSALINDSLEQIKTKKIEDKNNYSGKIKWIACEDRYFMYAIVPEREMVGTMNLSIKDNMVINQLVSPAVQIAPRSKARSNFLIFIGPKSMDLLNSLGHDLGKALNFGFFDIIAKPCLWFMNKIHGVIPNYGLAIIILTVFTKIILWPLGSKSYKSMSDMKKLQPLMAEIREKYKNDKQKMNQELMALYKTYKINPMGGCLPMVLQIPVFFALYRMLYQAIELRHAPFILWINDLSAPDRLFDFGFKIPFMEPPYGIPVLTIVMGATMLLQQKMSPPPGDPTQAKMMMLMPVVFTFIFINFSSGLVLYWLVNNVLSISQQYYVQKKSK
ncbi:membrane protein insertase YidC [Desulfosarcina ovata subsp. sediminis]|uniref:Membrane protein insertase YidC n=1 Tax=Desulfosarcina ovata subsp. sediminis TaxID=885957 RepID=A0A5K7ZV30_9BACT|nr:membrane protein insertase YidC [Desulfosarcina ovata]BBO84006.1 membrane protein insertase YidC [Desulfosarcina ovata subsp. sediminis]